VTWYPDENCKSKLDIKKYQDISMEIVNSGWILHSIRLWDRNVIPVVILIAED
jgi:hypothetical protein